MIRALLNTDFGRAFVHAPDVGQFYAKANEVWFENTTLLQQPGELDSQHQRLMLFDDVDGNMGTKVSGTELAKIVATVLNHLQRQGGRMRA